GRPSRRARRARTGAARGATSRETGSTTKYSSSIPKRRAIPPPRARGRRRRPRPFDGTCSARRSHARADRAGRPNEFLTLFWGAVQRAVSGETPRAARRSARKVVPVSGSVLFGVLAILAAVAIFVLVGLFYLGDRRDGPPGGQIGRASGRERERGGAGG